LSKRAAWLPCPKRFESDRKTARFATRIISPTMRAVQNSTFEDRVKGSIFERQLVTAALQQHSLRHTIGFRLPDHCCHRLYAAHFFSTILQKANTSARSRAYIEEGLQPERVADHVDILQGQIVFMVLAVVMHGVISRGAVFVVSRLQSFRRFSHGV
jgi:hypothetical protein